jgi:putative transposase
MKLAEYGKTYNSDGKMIYSCQYHVIFAPKYRRKVLKDGVDVRMKELILENQEKWKYKIIEMEIMPDHVHLLIESNPKFGIYNQINRIKGLTSNVLRKEFVWLKKRLPTLWSRSKFISTVGTVSLDVVKSYIENQKNQ